MVLAVAVFFCVCTTPSTVTKIYSHVHQPHPAFLLMTYFTLLLNSSCNLFIYVAFSKTFRSALKDLGLAISRRLQAQFCWSWLRQFISNSFCFYLSHPCLKRRPIPIVRKIRLPIFVFYFSFYIHSVHFFILFLILHLFSPFFSFAAYSQLPLLKPVTHQPFKNYIYTHAYSF